MVGDCNAGILGQPCNSGGSGTPAANSITTAMLQADAVTNAKLANMADSTIKGVAVGAGSSNPTDLTATQVVAILGNHPELRAQVRAVGLLGSTVNRIVSEDFVSNAQCLFTLASGGTGTAAFSNALQSGVRQSRTGANASSWSILYPDNVSHVDNLVTRRWYVRTVARLQTAVDAQAIIDMCAMRGNGANVAGAGIGVLGSASTVNFQGWVKSNAGVYTATDGPALDNDWHLFECWGDATNVSFAIDGTIFGTNAVGVGLGSQPVAMRLENVNQATAADRGYDIDFIAGAFEPILAGS